jgi:hypothetical protein
MDLQKDNAKGPGEVIFPIREFPCKGFGRPSAIPTSVGVEFFGAYTALRRKRGNSMNVGYPVHEYQIAPLKLPVPEWTAETEPAREKVPDDKPEPVAGPEKVEG